MTLYYNEGGITIYHGDCREILPTLPKVDLVLTDPPYGMGKAAWDYLVPPGEWLPFACRLGRVALFAGVRGLFDYPKPDWTCSWVRVASTQRNGTFGGFSNWEPILFYGGGHISNDTFSFPNIPDELAKGHPTPKPLRLMVSIIERLGARFIADPFMGSGTTLAAAKQLGRRAIGIEIEEKYCEIAAKRIEAARLTLFEHAGIDNQPWLSEIKPTDDDMAMLGGQDSLKEEALDMLKQREETK